MIRRFHLRFGAASNVYPLGEPDYVRRPIASMVGLILGISERTMSHPELEFFNELSGKLEIELTSPTEQIGNLENVRATPDAQIVTLRLTAEVFNLETDTFRDLTADELHSVAFRGAQITLRGESGGMVTHEAPNAEFFTVQQLLNAVAETERQSRDQSEWLGGVDVHHVYFEGIHPDEDEDNVWAIYWGS